MTHEKNCMCHLCLPDTTKEPGIMECKPHIIGGGYHGSEFKKIGDNITLGCISKEAGDLLSVVMGEWKEQEKRLKEQFPEQDISIYSFAYWLIRWSGLVEPSHRR